MFKKILIANWKENPETDREAARIFGAASKLGASKDVETVICPPFIYLDKLADIAGKLRGKNRVALGAQDIFWEDEGPYTGEVGPAMLRPMGVKYVIIGHSERRRWLGETDAMISKKIRAALGAGLSVVLCVGESATIREKGAASAQKFVKGQLMKDLKGIMFDKTIADRLIVAYEPIWAISTSDKASHDSPADARAMAVSIKRSLRSTFSVLRSTVLYGGSVNGENIFDYVHYKEIDGALVGGASLKADEWKRMVKAVYGAIKEKK